MSAAVERVEMEAAFLLHTRPWRESSRILEVFSQQQFEPIQNFGCGGLLFQSRLIPHFMDPSTRCWTHLRYEGTAASAALPAAAAVQQAQLEVGLVGQAGGVYLFVIGQAAGLGGGRRERPQRAERAVLFGGERQRAVVAAAEPSRPSCT